MLEKNLDKAIEKVLVSEEEIIEKSKELGEILTKEYKGKNPLVLGILRGSVPFLAELIKHIDCHLETDFMTVSSYHGGTKSSGEVKLILDVDTAVKGREILIVEDIIFLINQKEELLKLNQIIQDLPFQMNLLLALVWTTKKTTVTSHMLGF